MWNTIMKCGSICDTLPSFTCETLPSLWDPAPCGWSGLTGGSFTLASSERSQNIQIVGTPSNILIFTQFLREIDLARARLAFLRQHPHDLMDRVPLKKEGSYRSLDFSAVRPVMSPESVVGDTGCGVAQGHCRPLVISTTMRWSTKAVWSASKNWSTASLFQVCPPRLTWITKNIQLAYIIIYWLVVWNIIFPYIENVIIPTDLVIFFRGVGIPPTSIYHFPLFSMTAYALPWFSMQEPHLFVPSIGIIGQLGYAMDCPFFLLSQVGVSQTRHATWYPLVIYGNLTPCYG